MQPGVRKNVYIYTEEWPFPTERIVNSLKIHFRLERTTAILRKTIDGNLQSNRTERKFPFRSVAFDRLHSVPFDYVGNGKCKKTEENLVYIVDIMSFDEYQTKNNIYPTRSCSCFSVFSALAKTFLICSNSVSDKEFVLPVYDKIGMLLLCMCKRQAGEAHHSHLLLGLHQEEFFGPCQMGL
uniref:Uncharacterized protein n=1 Tax=Romanomermis culicivorax TaxID=13658 RepID=A0A915IGK5_ROMCU